MGKPCVSCVLVAILAVTLATAQSRAAQLSAPEYALKAAFLYNFTKFVAWPEESRPGAPIGICVIGRDPFGEILDSTLRGRTVRGRPLAVRRYPQLPDGDECRVAFFGHDEQARLAALGDRLRRRSILAVSEARSFGEPGGMIRLIVVDGRVRIEIDLPRARAAGLEISSRLLGLAVLTPSAGTGGSSP